jgi:hypothetical protein
MQKTGDPEALYGSSCRWMAALEDPPDLRLELDRIGQTCR